MSDSNPTPAHGRPEPLSMMWRVLAAPQTLMVLVGLIALALILSTLIPQIPPEARGEAQAWLAAQPGTSGPLGSIIQTLGLHDLANALWFHLLLVLVALCLLVRAVESAELAFRATAGGRWSPASIAAWGAHPPQVSAASPLPPEKVQSRLDDVFSTAGYRWDDVPEALVSSRVASRRALLLWARPVAYAALLVALAGIAILATWGWQGAIWQAAPGEIRDVGPRSPAGESSLQVRLDSFDLVLEDGQLRDHRSGITWLEDNTVLQQDTVAAGHPSTARGVSLRQVGYLPSIRLSGVDGDGSPLVLQSADQQQGGQDGLEVIFSTVDAQPAVLIPNHDLVLALSFEPACNGSGPLVNVGLLRSGATVPEPVGSLNKSRDLEINGLQLDLDIVYRPLLRLDHQPGMGLVVGSLLVALIALLMAWLLPPALVWVAVAAGKDGGAQIRALAPGSARASGWWVDLAGRLQEALAGDD